MSHQNWELVNDYISKRQKQSKSFLCGLFPETVVDSFLSEDPNDYDWEQRMGIFAAISQRYPKELSTRARGVLFHAFLFEEKDVREAFELGMIKRFRNCGKKTCKEIADCFGIDYVSGTPKQCPHCGAILSFPKSPTTP